MASPQGAGQGAQSIAALRGLDRRSGALLPLPTAPDPLGVPKGKSDPLSRRFNNRYIPPFLLEHPIYRHHPYEQSRLAAALLGSVKKLTQNKYASAVRSYYRHCALFNITPRWPVNVICFCDWLLRIATTVQYPSLKMYRAAIHYEQVNKGFAWDLSHHELVHRIMRHIKRTFPTEPRAKKAPVCLGVAKAILPLLPGWPNADGMSHDDRLFAAATIIAITGFLRGGEFLTHPQSDRSVLLANVNVLTVKDFPTLVVKVPQPKTNQGALAVSVPCFSPCDQSSTDFDPVTRWNAYLSKSPCSRQTTTRSVSGRTPAFHRRDGSALTRDWMVKKTTALMTRAGISFHNDLGNPLAVVMASWRSGGVRSAVDANVSREIIKELGRWKSNAFENYLLHSLFDLQDAARTMWAVSEKKSGLRLGLFSAGGMFASEDAASAAEVTRVCGR